MTNIWRSVFVPELVSMVTFAIVEIGAVSLCSREWDELHKAVYFIETERQ